MMAGIARLDDLTKGHEWSPTPAIEASKDTFVNSKGVVRIGDKFQKHSLPYPPVSPHDTVSAQGSTTVYVNGLAVSRIGDVLSCTDVIDKGSTDTFAGG